MSDRRRGSLIGLDKRAAQPKGVEKAAPNRSGEALAADLLSDPGQQLVVAILVTERRTRPRRLARGLMEWVVSGHGDPGTAHHVMQPRLLRAPVPDEPAGVRQQLANRDLPRPRHIGQPPRDHVVEAEPALLVEAKHESRHEGLGDTPSRERRRRCHRSRRADTLNTSNSCDHSAIGQDDCDTDTGRVPLGHRVSDKCVNTGLQLGR